MTIAFTKTNLPGGWLGNMSPHPVHALGHRWPRAEHLFQAMRLPPHFWGALIKEPNPMRVKDLARSLYESLVVEPMSEEDLDNMRFVLRAKIRTNPDLRPSLIATEKQLIIEDVTSRAGRGSAKFWGAALVGNRWVGDNWLGKLWMEIRETLT